MDIKKVTIPCEFFQRLLTLSCVALDILCDFPDSEEHVEEVSLINSEKEFYQRILFDTAKFMEV